MKYPYYELTSGELISKDRIDSAIELPSKLRDLSACVMLTEDELFSKGDKIQAIRVFRMKHDCSVMEAKTAIEHLRGEN